MICAIFINYVQKEIKGKYIVKKKWFFKLNINKNKNVLFLYFCPNYLIKFTSIYILYIFNNAKYVQQYNINYLQKYIFLENVFKM